MTRMTRKGASVPVTKATVREPPPPLPQPGPAPAAATAPVLFPWRQAARGPLQT